MQTLVHFSFRTTIEFFLIVFFLIFSTFFSQIDYYFEMTVFVWK